MRTSFTLLASTLFAAAAMASDVQPEARATPAPIDLVRRGDVIISGGSISCSNISCREGYAADERCNCVRKNGGSGTSGSSFETTILGSGLSSESGSSSSGIDEEPASTDGVAAGLPTSTDIFGPGGVFGEYKEHNGGPICADPSLCVHAGTSTASSSSTSSSTRSPAPTTTRDPNAAGSLSPPGFKAAAAGLALGVAAFVL